MSQRFPTVMLTSEDLHRLAFRRRADLHAGSSASAACIRQLVSNDELHRPFVNTRDELIGLVYTK